LEKPVLKFRDLKNANAFLLEKSNEEPIYFFYNANAPNSNPSGAISMHEQNVRR